jgi:hypothetical protein
MTNIIWMLLSVDWYSFGFKHLLWDLFIIGLTIAFSNKQKLNIGLLAIEYAITNDEGNINNIYVTRARDIYENFLNLFELYIKPMDNVITKIIVLNMKLITNSDWFNYVVYGCILRYTKKTEHNLDITFLIKKFGMGYIHSEHTIKREDIMDKYKLDLKKSGSHHDLTNQDVNDDEVRKFQELLMSGISNMEKNINHKGLDKVDMGKIEQNMMSSLEEISKAFTAPLTEITELSNEIQFPTKNKNKNKNDDDNNSDEHDNNSNKSPDDEFQIKDES